MKSINVKVENNHLSIEHDTSLNRYQLLSYIATACVNELARTKPGRNALSRDFHGHYIATVMDLDYQYVKDFEERHWKKEDDR